MSSKFKEIIRQYFLLGLQQEEILAFLRIIHDIYLSHRSLKRILSRLQLWRNKNYSDIHDVISFIEHQLERSGQMVGYRWMHLKCLQNGFVVTQEVVRQSIKLLDPYGVEIRKRKRLRRRQYSSKGPNYLWHMDSYDKLKPYGICINGCIDGYSRYVIWLKAGRTSSDSKVIAGYYLNAVESLGGCPQTLRSDLGTENKTTEIIQNALRDIIPNGRIKPAFLYGRSTANQRIEAWWSILRKQSSQFWMNLFGILKDDGYFNGTCLDKALIQFCFLDMIQDELDNVVKEWNTHKVRKSRNGNLPTGRPIILFELNHLYSCQNYLVEVPSNVTDFLKEECRLIKYPCDKDVFNLCNYLVHENDLNVSTDCYDAVKLYIELWKHIYQLLQNP